MEDLDVELHHCSYVNGTRTAAYFGPVTIDLFYPAGPLLEIEEDWLKAEQQLLEALRDKIRALGGNAGVSLEVTCDPFARTPLGAGLWLHAVCTAAKLEDLF